MNIPSNLKYTASHEWVKVGDDGLLWIGITDAAQDMLGDLVFVGDFKVGDTLKAGETAGVVESVKAASDVYAPVDGEIVAFNDALEVGAAAVELHSVRCLDLQDEDQGARSMACSMPRPTKPT